MRRREFIALLAGTVTWPVAASGQSKTTHLGVLLFSTPNSDPQMSNIREGLRDLGHVEGKNLLVMYRYGDGSYERLPQLAAQLVAEKPDLLLALGGDVALLLDDTCL